MKLSEIIKMVEESNSNLTSRIIAIDGPGGAGKTVLAERLAKELGDAQVIHTDDFFDPVTRSNWWKRLVKEVLEPLSKNEIGKYQRYDWDTKSLNEWHTVEPADFIILEGVQSSRSVLRDYLSLKIWVETPRNERLRRRLERDGEDTRNEWEQWMAQEDAYVRDEHPDQSADLTVLGTDPVLIKQK